MSKLANGRAIAVTLVAADSVGDVKMIGTSACRIISKSSPTRGVVLRDGVVQVTKQGQAWTQFQNIYWDNGNNRFTTTVGSNVLAGLAAKPSDASSTLGELLLNGLPAVDGD